MGTRPRLYPTVARVRNMSIQELADRRLVGGVANATLGTADAREPRLAN